MKGAQKPRLCIEPKRTSTDGEQAAFLMRSYSSPLDPWQQEIIDTWLGKDDAENYTMTSGGLTVPRQNGKNFCLEAREFYGLLVNGEKIIHTAHQVRTAEKSFKHLAAYFENKKYPELQKAIKHIWRSNGGEAIELKNGGLIEYSARSRQAARGFDGISLIVFDEAQELTDDQLEAIMATLSASDTGIRQLIFTGTPPYPGCPGTVFRRRRKMCKEAPGEHDAWHEWGVEAESLEDIDIADKKLWYDTNPALGRRLSEDFTQEEFRTMSPDGFARERLGWWSPVLTDEDDIALDVKAWAACKSSEKKPSGKTAYGVKFTADGTEVALCGAVCPKDAPARISLIKRASTAVGVSWLADWLNDRVKRASCVVIDGRNGVDLLCDKIHTTWKNKDSVIRAKASDVIAAASQLIYEVNEQSVTWYEGQEDLNDSATTSIKRPISGGFGFGGDNAAPIEAASLALWGARNSKRDPNKKMRIG